MRKKKSSQYFIGTSGWTYPSWQGVFYSTEIAKKNWLPYYATQFNAVEINATFYRYFKNATYLKWYKETPAHFRFIVKVPQYISHRKLLLDCALHIKRFRKQAYLLKDKLGLILLQLPARMPYDVKRLKNALKAFNVPHKIAVEFRHKKWMTDEVFHLLKRQHCIFVSTDSPESKLMKCLPTEIAYLRLHGIKKWYDYNYTKNQLLEIKRHLKYLEKHGAKQLYVFFNNDYHAYAVKNALYLKKIISS